MARHIHTQLSTGPHGFLRSKKKNISILTHDMFNRCVKMLSNVCGWQILPTTQDAHWKLKYIFSSLLLGHPLCWYHRQFTLKALILAERKRKATHFTEANWVCAPFTKRDGIGSNKWYWQSIRRNDEIKTTVEIKRRRKKTRSEMTEQKRYVMRKGRNWFN